MTTRRLAAILAADMVEYPRPRLAVQATGPLTFRQLFSQIRLRFGAVGTVIPSTLKMRDLDGQ
jgi:hypothetical protein